MKKTNPDIISIIATKPVQAMLATALLLVISNSATAQQTVSHNGSVTKSFTEPIESNTVAAVELGVVQEANIREGDRVKSGQQLAALNSDVLVQSRRIAVAKSKSTATRDAAKSRFVLIDSQLRNLQSLAPGGHVNKYELQQKFSEFENAKAELARAEDELSLSALEVDRIDAQIQQRKITSPIDGTVVKIHRKLGEQVSTSNPEYATIVRIDQLKVKFFLDSDTLESINIGSVVSIQVGKESRFRNAQVIFVSPIIDPDSGTGRVEVVLDNHDLRLRSGTVCYWSENRPAAREAKFLLEAPDR